MGGYLSGNDPGYPEKRVLGALEDARARVQRMRNDPATADTRLSGSPNNMNPGGGTWGLVELMLSGLPSRHIGTAWHARLRYLDPVLGRPGVPEDVAALVHLITDDEVNVTIVNLSPVNSRAIVVQAGAYAEHQFVSVDVDGKRTLIDDSGLIVKLAPGAGCHSSWSATPTSRHTRSPGR